MSCDTYFAAPSRRVVEIARRFDESPLCGGNPCHNGIVRSICANDFTSAMRAIVSKIQSRLTGRCLPRRLNYQPTVGSDMVTRQSVSCLILETRPAGDDSCPADAGRVDPRSNPLDPNSPRTAQRVTTGPNMGRRLCEVQQVYLEGDPATAMTMPLRPQGGQAGWYYDTNSDPSNPTCTQRISYTDNAFPPTGSITQLQCIQRVSGGSTTDAGAGGG